MKIFTSTKKIINIELHINDLKNSLKNYQLDKLHDLEDIFKKENRQYELYYNLLRGEHSDWFSDLIEKNNIYWIETPSFDTQWKELVESFPHVFIHDAVNVLKDVAPEDLKVFLVKDQAPYFGEAFSSIDSAKLVSNL